MSDNGKTGVIMVLTSDSLDKILADAGVFVPRVNPDRAKDCQYVVCVQNNPQNDSDETLFGHREAFLIGTISGVSPANNDGERLIKFDSYAEIHKRHAWTNGPTRIGIAYFDSPTEAKLRIGRHEFKPVKFAKTEKIMADARNVFADIDFAEQPAQAAKSAIVTPTVKNTGFDLTEAKGLIAKALGISIDQVEIIVKV